MVMALTPLKGFWNLQDQLNRRFVDVFGGLLRQPEGLPRTQPAEWAPAVDVLFEDGDLLIRADLPGLEQEDVHITLQDNVLTISGERKAEREEERGGYYVRERRSGSFWRSMTLPKGTDESKISARFEDGLLEVRVRGAAVIKEPKRIQIEGGKNSGS
jgi:HSP20 family protein